MHSTLPRSVNHPLFVHSRQTQHNKELQHKAQSAQTPRPIAKRALSASTAAQTDPIEALPPGQADKVPPSVPSPKRHRPADEASEVVRMAPPPAPQPHHPRRPRGQHEVRVRCLAPLEPVPGLIRASGAQHNIDVFRKLFIDERGSFLWLLKLGGMPNPVGAGTEEAFPIIYTHPSLQDTPRNALRSLQGGRVYILGNACGSRCHRGGRSGKASRGKIWWASVRCGVHAAICRALCRILQGNARGRGQGRCKGQGQVSR
jgi:hypothetical protein